MKRARAELAIPREVFIVFERIEAHEGDHQDVSVVSVFRTRDAAVLEAKKRADETPFGDGEEKEKDDEETSLPFWSFQPEDSYHGGVVRIWVEKHGLRE